MERNRSAFALGDVRRRQFLKVLRLVFDDGQLQRQSDLRRGQAYAWSVAHRVRHGFDQVLNRAAQNLVVRKAAGFLPQDWFAGLQDFKFHMGGRVGSNLSIPCRPSIVGRTPRKWFRYLAVFEGPGIEMSLDAAA